ncbi:MAG: molybdopterin-dependent oxidoreductase, partial [Firmicutes bacterium]|nr:molybdopterin-dependent oxidoreductase [Bacillota bacterium]
GGFGGKESQANLFAAVAAVGAARTGRPVLVRLDRRLDSRLTGKRHPMLARFTCGFDPDGRLLALDVTLYADAGFSLDLSEAVLLRALVHIDNAYWIPHFRATGYLVRTDKPSQTAFRGFGGPQGMVVGEEVLDRVARAVGQPAEAVRARNFYRPGQETPYGQPVGEAGRLRELWDTLAADAGLAERRRAAAAFNAAHPHWKRGVAMTPVKFGISFNAGFLNQAGALVAIYRDGSVRLVHGGVEMGQGVYTKVRQLVADTLGLDPATVVTGPTRTDHIPNTSATAASTGTDLNGQAALRAARRLRARLARVAAGLLGCDPGAVRFAGGRVGPAGGRDLPWAAVVEAAYLARIPLWAAGFYRTPGLSWDPGQARGRPFAYFALGAALAEVEVDGRTGEYTLRAVDILHDAGRPLHPAVDRGQVEGGFLQGVGWLTREEVVWDGEGRLLTPGASTYKLPTLADLPAEFRVRFLPPGPGPAAVAGSKAVGEPPFMLAIAVREALKEAVAAFGPGPEAVELPVPATPEAVYQALETRRRRLPAEEAATDGHHLD